ncbi:MAG: transglycosylase domain-containing protein [Clostridia bacterium]|nr:transglycosylase domain-containing protein [Clostridia bacterium]
MSKKSQDIYSSSNHGRGREDSVDLSSFSSSATDIARKKRRRKKNGKQRVIKIILSLFLIGIISISIITATFLIYAFTFVDGTMDQDLDDLRLNFTTTIYAQNKDGKWKEYQRLHGEYNRIWVGYDRKDAQSNAKGYKGMPESLINAFVAIEDKRFREHDGIDWKRTISAFLNLLQGSKSYGGSTITQQLVKNLTNDNSKRVSRKVREIMRARYLEGHYSKDTIIECYLNTISLGHGLYGVEVASNYYFNKNVKDLNLNECAALAAITKSPAYYAPDTHPEENKKRRITVLNEMLEQGYITDEEYEKAKNSELKIVASKDLLNEEEVNNYFVDSLITQVTNDLAEKYNYDSKTASFKFYNGGYKIYATIDPKIQSAVDTVFSNSKAYGLKGADGKQLQGAITVMDYEGHVRGIAGGIGEKTENRGFNRAISAKRQPGSTIKPLSAYAPAIEKGLITYSSIVNDKRLNYGGWKPVNWYRSYKGRVTVKYALEISINTVPVQLVDQLGTDVSYDFLTKTLGINTLTDNDKFLSPLGMGGTNGGLNTTESAGAFAIFGNGGYFYKPTFYTKVCDQQDEIVLNGESDPTVAVGEDTSVIMNNLLQNVVYGDSGSAKGAGNYVPNMKVYGKTGTSNDVNDLWFVGGSPYYIASCWCGYDTQQKVSVSSIARTMWGGVMSKIHSGLKAKEFPKSDYVVRRYFCSATGMLATDACSSPAVGWYSKNHMPALCKSHSGKQLDSPEVVEKRKAEEEEKKAAEKDKKKDNSSKKTTSSQN